MGPEAKRHARTALTWALMLLVDLAAFVPRLIFPNPYSGGTLEENPTVRPTLPGLSYELGLVFCALALTAGTRWKRPVRVVATVLFAAFLVFSLYHEAYLRFIFSGPAIVDDWRLLLNLAHFIRIAQIGWTLSVIAWAVGYVLAVVLAAYTFARLQAWAAGTSFRARIACAVAFLLIGGAALTWVPPPPANAVIQPLSDGVAANVKASRTALASWRAIFDAPPDTRYDGFAALPLVRRPNVYLLMLEAYGELLATCPSNRAYRDLLGRIGTRLEASGFRARSGYSTSPIYGGRSWMAMASVQTGVRIDSQPAYRVLEKTAAQVPTLTSFFQAHGYHTMMLQPMDGHRVGITDEDIYRRDRRVIRDDLPYRGVPNGIVGVPDQYSLGYFDAHILAGAPEPRFFFYMPVSTHYPWFAPAPFVRDWKRLDETVRPEDVVPWPPLAGEEALPSRPFAAYFATVVYEWRVLADFIDARRNEDALIIVVGDHQPTRLACPGVPVTFNAPVHVLSRDAALVDRFADVGLTPGLYAEPGRAAPLKHEGLFSLLVGKLSAVDRALGVTPPPYLPAGIGLNGLRR